MQRFGLVLALTTACGGAALSAGCPGQRHLEPLGVESASPRGRWRIEMLVRTGGRARDAWVARVHGGNRASVDVVLPSVASNEGDRTVSQRRPRLVWDQSEERVLVETIGSGFVVLYLPPSDRPFICEHRVVSPDEAHAALTHTPTLAKLEEEILTEDDKPHGRAEQEYVLRRLERAGATSSIASVLVPAVMHGSNEMDRGRIVRLAIARLAPGAGLPENVRASELARLRRSLEEFVRTPDRAHATVVARAIQVLGALPREESERPLVPALEAAVGRCANVTALAEAVDAVGPLAWLAGKWRLAEAGPALTRTLACRHELPWKTRVSRNLALWASVRLDVRDAATAVLPLLDDPAVWIAGGRRADVPPDAAAEASPSWADDTPLGVAFAWAATRLQDARAVPALRAALERRDLPDTSAAAAARALLALDPAQAADVIRRAPAVSDEMKRQLLGGQGG